MSTAGATPDQNSPYVNLVLDNGLTLEGVESRPLPASLYQGTQGYPSADIWVQMSPQNLFYSSFAIPPGVTPIDTRLTGRRSELRYPYPMSSGHVAGGLHNGEGYTSPDPLRAMD